MQNRFPQDEILTGPLEDVSTTSIPIRVRETMDTESDHTPYPLRPEDRSYSESERSVNEDGMADPFQESAQPLSTDFQDRELPPIPTYTSEPVPVPFSDFDRPTERIPDSLSGAHRYEDSVDHEDFEESYYGQPSQTDQDAGRAMATTEHQEYRQESQNHGQVQDQDQDDLYSAPIRGAETRDLYDIRSALEELSTPSQRSQEELVQPLLQQQQQDEDDEDEDEEFVPARWQPDAEVTYCPICHSQFSIFIRKHHCR